VVRLDRKDCFSTASADTTPLNDDLSVDLAIRGHSIKTESSPMRALSSAR
jgi:hypothetical protein